MPIKKRRPEDLRCVCLLWGEGLLDAAQDVIGIRISVLIRHVGVAASVYDLAAADHSVEVIVVLQRSVGLRASVR